jgi:hypothetical protein
MSDENKKTINDPVDPETVKQLADLTAARYDAADALLELEQRRVTILVSAKQIDDEKARVFNRILLERGLPPGTPIEIDGQTGQIVAHSSGDKNPPPVA